MTTHFDEGDGEPGRDLDDPLTVILRPSSTEYLGPPTGRYESIRRGANRRRLLRATLGAGATCAVIALVALPFRLSHHDSPTTPTVPLAPPPASSSAPTASPSQAPSATKAPSSTPTASPSSPADVRTPSRTVVPTTEPSRVASEPSAVATQAR
ncbi:hypothetical protein [Streptomyces prunicolor]|uniref:Uncharacterized protein n=1 Tax=Streptomyces prunicolor TaxID=67348 RepID=A0ABU4FUB8_9ACTN|nr:hypothetical protein [Streptomyces prunicolor]MDV7223521.1 hypothetical protein [Streptomyces prunicolor]